MDINRYAKYLNKEDRPPAFILGSYLTTGLGIIRDLSRKNIPTFLFDSNPNQIAFYSKYCHNIICPNPKDQEKKYIDQLQQIGEQLADKAVLMPTSDTDIRAILKHKDSLKKYYEFPLANLEITDKLLNKKTFYTLVKKYKIPHPQTFFPNNKTDLIDISKTISYPCILKPVFSSYFRSDFNTKLFMVKNRSDLIKNYDLATLKNHAMMIQEIITGGSSNNFGFNTYYDKKMCPNGIFTYQRIRTWPPLFGNGCLIKNVKKPELEEIVTGFIKKIGYFGIVDAEFKRDPQDNINKIIEINPRAWMQHSLATRCGLNFAYFSYLDAIGRKIGKTKVSHEPIKWLYAFDDISSSRKSIIEKKMTIKEWLFSLKGSKEYAICSKTDPLPFFVLGTKTVFSIIPALLMKKNEH